MEKYQESAVNYYQDEDGVFTAHVPAIRGCVAWGKTLEEAYRNAIDAIESCLEARRKVAALSCVLVNHLDAQASYAATGRRTEPPGGG